MKKIISLALSVILIFSAVSPCFAATKKDSATTIRLEKYEGTLTVKNASGKSQSTKSNMRLYDGYKLTTAKSSYGYLSLDSSKVMKMDASTTVGLSKSGNKLDLMLENGTVVLNVTEKLQADEELNINTSNMVTGIRGTIIEVTHEIKLLDRDVKELSLLPSKIAPSSKDKFIFKIRPSQLLESDSQRATEVTTIRLIEGEVKVTPTINMAGKINIELTNAVLNKDGSVTLKAGQELIIGGPDTNIDGSLLQKEFKLTDLEPSTQMFIVENADVQSDILSGTDFTQANIDELIGTAADALKADEAAAEKQAAENKANYVAPDKSDEDVIIFEDQPSSGGGGGGGSTPTTYTVSFNANGHGTAPASQTVESGGFLTEPAAPTADGYIFGGWFTDAECKTGAWNFGTDTVASSFTLYAQWKCTVTFNTEAIITEPITPPAPQECACNTAAAQPTGLDYTVYAWYTSDALTEKYDFSTPVTENITLYLGPLKYVLSFETNGGNPAINPRYADAASGFEASIVDIRALSKDGYTLDAWYYDEACTSPVNMAVASIPLTEDTTIYAKWNPISYTIAYNNNNPGGELEISGSMDPSPATYDENITLRANEFVSYAGATFIGWSLTEGGTTVVYQDGATVSNLTAMEGDRVNLYAVWAYKFSITNNASSLVALDVTTMPNTSLIPDASGYCYLPCIVGAVNQITLHITLVSDGSDAVNDDVIITVNGGGYDLSDGYTSIDVSGTTEIVVDPR